MEDIYIRLGKRVRELRLKSDLTQERVAELTGLSVPFIGQIERGENRASLVTIQRIADALTVPIETIFTEIYPPPGKPVAKYDLTYKVANLLREKGTADKQFILDLVKLIDRRIRRKNK